MVIIRRILLCCTAVVVAGVVDVSVISAIDAPMWERPAELSGVALFVWDASHILLDVLLNVSGLILASIVIFLACERLMPRRPRAKHVAFILSLLPVTAILVLVSIGSPGETASPAETLQVGFTYYSQAMAGYIALILTSPRKRPDGAGG